MKKIEGFILCAILLGASSCTGKFSPYTNDNHYDTIFGYPPKVIAKFLDIEDELTVDPSDLNKERPRY